MCRPLPIFFLYCGQNKLFVLVAFAFRNLVLLPAPPKHFGITNCNTFCLQRKRILVAVCQTPLPPLDHPDHPLHPFHRHQNTTNMARPIRYTYLGILWRFYSCYSRCWPSKHVCQPTGYAGSAIWQLRPTEGATWQEC